MKPESCTSDWKGSESYLNRVRKPIREEVWRGVRAPDAFVEDLELVSTEATDFAARVFNAIEPPENPPRFDEQWRHYLQDMFVNKVERLAVFADYVHRKVDQSITPLTGLSEEQREAVYGQLLSDLFEYVAYVSSPKRGDDRPLPASLFERNFVLYNSPAILERLDQYPELQRREKVMFATHRRQPEAAAKRYVRYYRQLKRTTTLTDSEIRHFAMCENPQAAVEDYFDAVRTCQQRFGAALPEWSYRRIIMQRTDYLNFIEGVIERMDVLRTLVRDHNGREQKLVAFECERLALKATGSPEKQFEDFFEKVDGLMKRYGDEFTEAQCRYITINSSHPAAALRRARRFRRELVEQHGVTNTEATQLSLSPDPHELCKNFRDKTARIKEEHPEMTDSDARYFAMRITMQRLEECL